jgi:hypothetical protein
MKGTAMVYTLNLSATKEQLERFYESQSYFVVAKSTGEAEPNVLWQVFRPLAHNAITWEEQYGIYASTTFINNKAKILQMSETEYPAVPGAEYTLLDSGVFGKPRGGEKGGTYVATNSYTTKPMLTFGLFQSASINEEQVSGNAISAVPVLLTSTAKMTPYTTLNVWVQSEARSNTVVTEVTSPRTAVTFGGDKPEASLAYDSASGHFLPKSQAGLPEGVSLQTYEAPALL